MPPSALHHTNSRFPIPLFCSYELIRRISLDVYKRQIQYRKALGMLVRPDLAEEAVQESYLTLVKKWEQLHSPQALSLIHISSTSSTSAR